MKEGLPAAGTVISDYRILSPLGAGGMGEVYLAEDTQLDRKVAIKFLPAESVADEQAKKRLVREAKAAAKLDHPHICSIYEVGEENGRSFIVMQYVPGETLDIKMKRKPLDLPESLSIATQVADALAEAHAHGIIHRDIKPSNIIITSRGQAKVMDFGLAKLAREGVTTDSEAETQSLLTTPGMIIGTVPYMSPEQVRGEILDARSDIFSFGAVLYEMVCGRRPFMADSAAAAISAILRQEPLPIARYSIEAPAELQRIVSKTLRKDKEERYQTIKDLLIDLKNLSEELALEAKRELSIPPDSSDRPATATGDKPVAVTAATEPATGSGESVVRTTSSAEYVVSSITRHKRGAVLAVIALMLAIAVAAYFAIGSKSEAIDSLAVLPFVNASADSDTEYLSDGITDSLINSLSQLPKLKVMSRNSVFRYKGRDADAQAAGKQLGVQAVLTGRVAQRGDSLSISTELVDARDNSHLWGAQYNRKLSDILAVQTEISREVSEKLRLRLSSDEQKRVARHYTDNVEAYQLYIKGRYYWNKRTEEAFKKGIEYFRQAIEKDPNYTLAYTGLADSYALLGYTAALPPREAVARAKAAATKALDLDDTLAEAHTSLAQARLYDWDWAGAEREHKRAIELNPNYPTGHHWYAAYLISVVGRQDEALAEIRRAQELDPLSLGINMNVGAILNFARQYDQAIEQCLKTLDLDPTFSHTHWVLGQAYEHKQRYGEAVAEFQKAITFSGGNPLIVAWFGHAQAVSGKRGEAIKILGELKELSKQRYVSPYCIAIIYAGLGERDQAFEWLEKAFEERSSLLVVLKMEPGFDSLRSDPRFADLVRRVGL